MEFHRDLRDSVVVFAGWVDQRRVGTQGKFGRDAGRLHTAASFQAESANPVE
jgi:hypothetical protein